MLRVVRELEKGAWPRVVNEAVTSGELREMLLGLAAVFSEGASTPDETIPDAHQSAVRRSKKVYLPSTTAYCLLSE